jgi:hypothetical protein
VLVTALSAAVGLRVMEIEAGNVPEVDLSSVSRLLATRGDSLLFKSKKKGETAQVFNETAKAIAVLSFLPGGITLFGQLWQNNSGGLPDVSKEALNLVLSGQKRRSR